MVEVHYPQFGDELMCRVLEMSGKSAEYVVKARISQRRDRGQATQEGPQVISLRSGNAGGAAGHQRKKKCADGDNAVIVPLTTGFVSDDVAAVAGELRTKLTKLDYAPADLSLVGIKLGGQGLRYPLHIFPPQFDRAMSVRPF